MQYAATRGFPMTREPCKRQNQSAEKNLCSFVNVTQKVVSVNQKNRSAQFAFELSTDGVRKVDAARWRVKDLGQQVSKEMGAA